MKIKDGLKRLFILICGIIILSITIFLSQDKLLNNASMNETILATSEIDEARDKFERNNSIVSSRAGIREEDLSTEIINKAKENASTAITIPMEQYIELSEVSISFGMNLNVRTGLSKKDFKILISRCRADTSKWFYNNADLIYDLCKKYSINEIFFCGLISAESGWNIVSAHRATNNFTSLMSNGKLIHYGSLAEGLETSARVLHEKYLTPGGSFYHGSTITGVGRVYCPESTWPGLVYGRMQQIV